MVSQYPHTIVITAKPDPVQDPVTLVYSAVTGGNVVHTFACRAEANSSGRKIVGRDGSVYDYSFVVYLRKMTTIIPEQSDCSLTIGNMVVTSKVKGASNGQLNSRIWV